MPNKLDSNIYFIASKASYLVPLVLSVICAAPESYWLDSPEFSAAAQMLALPHPPGHPLYVMLTKPFTLLPFGSIAFRVSVASAVFGAMASFVTFRMIFAILASVSLDVPPWARAIISATAAIFAATTYAWWFQSVRQEVYALQILLVAGAMYALIRHTLDQTVGDTRFLFAAAFLFGLGLSNHHYIILAVAPCAIPVLLLEFRGQKTAQTLKKLGALAATASAGLLPYLFLPLRTMAGAPISLGGVHSIADFFWVVSARVYQKSMVRAQTDPLGIRTMDTVYSMMSELNPILFIVALAGLYLLIRRRSSRIIGVILSLAAGVTLLLRAILGADPFNPDYYGYMLPVILVLCGAIAVFLTVVLHVAVRTTRFWPVIAALLLVLVIATTGATARENRARCDLSDFRATRHFADFALEKADEDTLVLVAYYNLFFTLWSTAYVDGFRPDIQVINPQFLGYPGYLYAISAKRPELKRLAWSMFVTGRVTEAAVADLANAFPLRIEPAPWTEDAAFSHLIPDGPLYRAMPEPLASKDALSAAAGHFEQWRKLYLKIGPLWSEPETFRMLTYEHYLDALFFARRGDRVSALHAVEQARAIGASAHQIISLEDALRKEETGPLDVTPFLGDMSAME